MVEQNTKLPSYAPANPHRSHLDFIANAVEWNEAHVAAFQEQLGPNSIGMDAIVLYDHDGPDGRWVGEFVEIVGYKTAARYMPAPYPFEVRSKRGALLHCSASMLGPIR